MIASLSGKILYKFPEKLIVDVNGVGYEVFLPVSSFRKLPEIGQKIFLHIHTYVREDTLTLFGFHDPDEKEMFLLLMTVSGIGPKLALAILSGIEPGEFVQAVVSEDISRLTGLSGVGKKKAERLCLELKDKVQFIPISEESTANPPGVGVEGKQLVSDVVSALVNLGYPQADARQAVDAVYKKEDETGLTLEKLLRLSLRSLV